MNEKVREIKTKDSQENEKVIFVKKPTAKQLLDARAASIKVFTDALNSDAYTREQMADVMKERNIWGEKQEKQLEELSEKIRNGTRLLAQESLAKKEDGTPYTLEELVKLAFKVEEWRAEQINISLKQRELDQYTLQGQADNAEFNYLVANCTFDEEKNLVFKGVEDYLDKQEEPYAYEAARALAEITNKVDPDYEKKLPENKFLVRYGYKREKDLLLTRPEDNKLVDREGRLVNEKGFYVNEKDELVDKFGNRVDEDGNPIEESKPFESALKVKVEEKVAEEN